MFRFEFDKFRRQRLFLAAAVLTLLLIYLLSAFGGIGMMAEWKWNLNTFWNDKEYHREVLSRKAETIDSAWIQKVQEEYHAFVDENRRTDEEIRLFMNEWYGESGPAAGEDAPEYESVIADPYNYSYAYLVLNEDAYYSNRLEYFDEAFRFYIPLAQDAPACLRDRWEHEENTGYSRRQLSDREQLADSVFENFTPVTGSSCGWDVLICAGQNLPYTLGLALLAVLCTSFSTERAFSMRPLLRTARKGRNRLAAVKLARAWLITTILWGIFQFSILITAALAYGLEGADVTVMYLAVPSIYGLSNLQYYLIQTVFSYFGTLTFGLFVCLLSCLLPLRVSLPLGLVFTLITGYPNQSFAFSDQCFDLWEKIAALSPAQLMSAFTTLQTYQSYDIGICLIRLPAASAAAIAAELIVMAVLIFRMEGGK